MKNFTTAAITFTFTAIALGALPIFAQDEKPKTFAEMASAMPDRKVTKERVMAMLDKTFDRADTRKERKLDEKQARQFQFFLREFTRDSGA